MSNRLFLLFSEQPKLSNLFNRILVEYDGPAALGRSNEI